MKLVFFLGLFLAVTALSFGQVENAAKDQKSQQKKGQRLKVVVNQDGKETRIDTTFNLADEKQIQFKIDSILNKYGKGGNAKGDHKVIILRDDNNRMHVQAGGNAGGSEHLEMFYTTSDSGKEKAHARKVIRMTTNGQVATINEIGDDRMPPPPPPPPVPPSHMKSFRFAGGDPFAMDPNDKDIISYDKKDIGKGLEKITIVRKKHISDDEKKEIEVKVEVKNGN